MKSRFYLVVVMLLMALTVWAGETPQEQRGNESGKTIEMTLSDAVSLALRSNRSIAITYLNRVTQKYDLQIAEAEFLPNIRVDIIADGTYTDAYATAVGDKNKTRTESLETGVTASATQKLPTGAQIAFGWEQQYTTIRTKTDGASDSESTLPSGWSVTLTQPLLKGGGITYNRASLIKARLTEQENLLNLRDDIGGIIASVISGYNNFYKSSRNLKIREAALEEAKHQLETNKILVETGRMAANELIQSEAQVADQEFSYEEAVNTVETNLLTLIDVLDIERNISITPADEVFLREVKPVYDDCLTIALKNNGAYAQKVNNVTRSELELMEEENSRLWDLGLSAQYGEDYEDALVKDAADDDKEREWYIGLNLTIPFEIYGNDRLVKRQDLLLAKKALKVARLNLEEARSDLETDVRNAVRNVHTQLALLKRARKSLELARQKLEVEKTKLNAGRSTLFQVVSFQNTLVERQEAEVNQTISYLTSLTTLDQLLGTTLDTWKIQLRDDYQALEHELLEYR